MAPDWKTVHAHERKAALVAEEFVEGLELSGPPIDPLAVAEAERPYLRTIGHDLGARFDGRLEYHPKQDCFLLFYNTRYDHGQREGAHHPRTRFSLAHELGHFLLDQHRAYLLSGGEPHGSNSEYTADDLLLIEREADAFAAGLLLPSSLAGKEINRGELTRATVNGIASEYATSRLSTLRRSVELSHFPCAVAAIRQGSVAWRRHSASLVEGGCWPSSWRELRSEEAKAAWEEFARTGQCELESEGRIGDWFETYDRDDLVDVYVTEQFFPIPVMGTLALLLTLDEDFAS